MSVGKTLAPATGLLTSGIKGLTNQSWIFWTFLAFLAGIIVFIIYRLFIAKKDQWTHKLRVRRVGQNGYMEEPFYIKMRRFPMIKGAEVFELEDPLLGGYLMPSLNEYTGLNEFSIVLDKNNRIYTNNGEKWDPNEKSAQVSGQHSEIDLARGTLKDDWQKLNKVDKRIDAATIAKYAFLGILVMGIVVIIVVGLQKWAESHDAKAEQARAMAQAMESLGKAMETIEATVNTQQLLVPELKDLKKTNNLQGLINSEEKNGLV